MLHGIPYNKRATIYVLKLSSLEYLNEIRNAFIVSKSRKLDSKNFLISKIMKFGNNLNEIKQSDKLYLTKPVKNKLLNEIPARFCWPSKHRRTTVEIEFLFRYKTLMPCTVLMNIGNYRNKLI